MISIWQFASGPVRSIRISSRLSEQRELCLAFAR
jgi:hypothetical protein